MLSRVFRGKFVAGLQRAFRQKKLAFFGACQSLAQEKPFAAFLRTLFCEDWVVYAKRPFGGPEHVLQYLARYTHRVAISNHRIVDVNHTHVTFRWKDYADHSKRRTMSLTHEEFLHRFVRMFCRKVFHASVTSDSWPIAGARSPCSSAVRYWRLCRVFPKRTAQAIRIFGIVLTARAQCA